MDNLVAALNKDLNVRMGCEACHRVPSTHVMFIHPKDKAGGCCGVFHICPNCMEHPYDFGPDKTFQYIKKFV